MNKKAFTKNPMKIEGLIDLLKSRNLRIDSTDDAMARKMIKRIGYYRLTGFMLPFQNKSRHNNHLFKPNYSIKDVIDVYDFDRMIRQHCLSILDEIEVALKASICDTMSLSKGAHWYTKSEVFNNGAQPSHQAAFAKAADYNIASNRPNKDVKEIFLSSYYSSYHTPAMPPGWMLRECATFRTWALVFKDLTHAFQKNIANKWEYPNGQNISPMILNKWLLSISVFRNKCAHHARITNKKFTFSPTAPSEESVKMFFRDEITDLRTMFLVLAVFTNSISIHSSSEWLDELRTIFSRFDPSLHSLIPALTGVGMHPNHSHYDSKNKNPKTVASKKTPDWQDDTLWFFCK